MVAGDDIDGKRRHGKVGGAVLNLPGEESRQRSRSPIPAGHPSRRSRSPASYHRVPENVSRSLSPPDLRYEFQMNIEKQHSIMSKN